MAIERSDDGDSSPKNSPTLQLSTAPGPARTSPTPASGLPEPDRPPSTAARVASVSPRRSPRIAALSAGQPAAEMKSPRKRSTPSPSSGNLGSRRGIRSVRRNVDREGDLEPHLDGGGKGGRRSCDEDKGKVPVDDGDEMGVQKEEVVDIVRGGSGSRRVSRVEKGKGKLVDLGSMNHETVVEAFLDGEQLEKSWEEMNDAQMILEREMAVNKNRALQLGPRIASSEVKEEEGQEKEGNVGGENPKKYRKAKLDVARGSSRILQRRAANKKVALRVAKEFAYFHREKEDGEEVEEEDEDEDFDIKDEMKEKWPGPFSGMIQDLQQSVLPRMPTESFSKGSEETGSVKINWKPLTGRNRASSGNSAPSLVDLCLAVLCQNAEEIESLEGVPDSIKTKLLSLLYSSRKINSCIIRLILGGTPVEVRLSDCTWATEGMLEELLSECITGKLKVLQLDLCGRGMSDNVLHRMLTRFGDSLQSLTTVSLKAAYRLSEDGLNALVSAAPFLDSINLCHCSFLTSTGIINLCHKLDHQLRELCIDECQNMDAMLILPALKKLKVLEVLSVGRLPNVSDKFVRKLFSGSHSNIRNLGFANCVRLTSASIKIIGENCSKLQVLDIRNVLRLTDSAIMNLAYGCRFLQKLKLCRTGFSDEAIAEFVDTSGSSLTELSLNKVEKVAEVTASAISRRCSSTLRSLDLSFCRNMTDEGLGLIVDSCINLHLLKLFGCTQVTNKFLNGHSNSFVKVIGLEGSILGQMDMSDYM